MQYARLGRSGLIVSRLAFGVMTFGHDAGSMGAVWKTGQEEANALVHRSLDAGINFFDTADGYARGQSEVMLGKALGARRKDVILSTKIGFRTGSPLTQAGSSMRHILNSAEECLKRLGTDYIDLLSIHRFDAYTPFEESARALDNLISRGLVLYRLAGCDILGHSETTKLCALHRGPDVLLAGRSRSRTRSRSLLR
jgi:aryl-alcohol dehydrogenase-like predicted oxidoreductase